MERIELAIGRLLLIGVLVSFSFVFLGGCFYLSKHGTEIVHYQSFHGEPLVYKSVIGIFKDAITLSSLGIIQLGLLTLVIIQILRVALTTYLFIKSRDKIFVCISLFILSVLIFSLF